MTTLKRLLTIWSKSGQEIDVGSLFDNTDPNNPALRMSGGATASASPLNYSVAAMTIEGDGAVKSIDFGVSKRIATLINDDTMEAHLGFGVSPVVKVGELNAIITYTGTDWVAQASGVASDGVYQVTPTAGDVAFINPGVEVSSIGVIVLQAPHGAIVDVALSSDGGATWNSPSVVVGTQRSDGVTGANLDTIDQFDATTQSKVFLYKLPFSGLWQMRLTNTGANPSVGTSPWNLFVDGAVYEEPGKSLVLLPNDVLPVNIAAQLLYYYAPAGVAQIRVLTE